MTIVVHLPAAVLGMDYALGEAGVMYSLRTDMRNAERITIDGDRAFKPLEVQSAGEVGRGCADVVRAKKGRHSVSLVPTEGSLDWPSLGG
jgi:hypothetical protein